MKRNTRPNLAGTVIVALSLSTACAHAQSFNVDWGSADTSPHFTYAAQGLSGAWNTFEEMPNFQRFPLLGLDGWPLEVDIMNIGFDVVESADILTTFGDDQALLDDCFVSYNDPIDGCIFMRFLEPGDYEVILYGIAPDDSSLLNRLRIDQNLEEPEFVGGQWTGSHEYGVTYMSQIATVGADGRLDLHSGLMGGNIRSVLNGMQVIQLPECPADLTGDREVDFFDVSEFLTAFAEESPVADFNGDEDFDFFDVSSFLDAFSEGCP